MFENESLRVVRVEGLAVREAPALSAPLADPEGGTITLGVGDPILVVGGPVAADDMQWFEVAVTPDPEPYPISLWVGWVAGGTNEKPSFAEADGFCPEPSLATISTLPTVARIGCYGSTRLRIDARQAAMAPGFTAGGTCVIDPLPAWLSTVCDLAATSGVNDDGGTSRQLLLHFNPAKGIEPIGLAPVGTIGPRLQIVGHFDDPAAPLCDAYPGSAMDPSTFDYKLRVLTCAGQFVVDSLEILD